ncbi:hypothetical protein BJX76DRAFT_345427 [Aspergillus varians]
MEGDRVSLKRNRAAFEYHESTDDSSERDGFDDSEEEEWWRDGDESEDLDSEQDIEEHEYTTSGDTARTVKFWLFLIDEGVDQSRWRKKFVAECTCDGVSVATALARYIYREDMHFEFWEKMEARSQEMCGVAFQDFDQYGTLKTKYTGHPVQRGTSRSATSERAKVSLLFNKATRFCLGEQGDSKDQDLIYRSNEAFERAWTLDALLVDKSAEERLMIRSGAQFGAIDFWRACGFCRITASCCFVFLFDFQHWSRALAAGSDFDPQLDEAEVKKLKLERLHDALLLHHAAFTLADNELKAFFVIHADDKIGWDRVTSSEATLLRLMACEFKPLSTCWLLENVHHADLWRTACDINGYTLREALQENHFRGYPDTAVSCLSLLSGQDTSCLERFLSARMRSFLIYHGETKYDLCHYGIEDGSFWIMDNDDYILVHLDPDRVSKNYLRRAETQMGCRAVLRYKFDADEKAGDGECLPTCRNDPECDFVTVLLRLR